MVRIFEMRQKEVINIRDGCRFGYLSDVGLDIDEGCVVAIIVPGPGRMFGLLGVEQEYHIPWCAIKQIGEDIILVDVDPKKIIVNCD